MDDRHGRQGEQEIDDPIRLIVIPSESERESKNPYRHHKKHLGLVMLTFLLAFLLFIFRGWSGIEI